MRTAPRRFGQKSAKNFLIWLCNVVARSTQAFA